MLTAHYIGDHAGDKLSVRAGAWLTRKAQKGPYGIITHTEAIHAEHTDGTVTIASSSLRDGGVRPKRVTLNPGNWRIVDVPSWAVAESELLLLKTLGAQYDLRGAISTVFLGSPERLKWFCSQWVAYPYIKGAAIFGPHHVGAICLSLGEDVTEEFFGARALGRGFTSAPCSPSMGA